MFYDCKSMKDIDGEWKKIFIPQQLKFLYQTIEKYVIENQKVNVIFAKASFKKSCITGFEGKYLPTLYDLCLKNNDLKKLIDVCY